MLISCLITLYHYISTIFSLIGITFSLTSMLMLTLISYFCIDINIVVDMDIDINTNVDITKPSSKPSKPLKRTILLFFVVVVLLLFLVFLLFFLYGLICSIDSDLINSI